MIKIDKVSIDNLIGYVHTLLDFIDIEDFEDEENVKLVKNGYDGFVTPIIKILEEATK